LRTEPVEDKTPENPNPDARKKTVKKPTIENTENPVKPMIDEYRIILNTPLPLTVRLSKLFPPELSAKAK